MRQQADMAHSSFCTTEPGWMTSSSTRPLDMALCTRNAYALLTPTLAAIFTIVGVVRATRLVTACPRLPDNRAPSVYWAKFTLPHTVTAFSIALLIHVTQASRSPGGTISDMAVFALATTVSSLVASVLHVIEHQRSLAPSITLCLYYFFNAIVLLWRLRAMLAVDLSSMEWVCFVGILAGQVVLLVLECVSERPRDPTDVQDDPKASPEPLLNFFSWGSFLWTLPILKLGTTKYLTLDDIWTLPPATLSRTTYSLLIDRFNKYRQRGAQHALLWSIARTFGGATVGALACNALSQIIIVAIPLLIEQLVGYVSNWTPGSSKSTGIIIAFAMFGTYFVSTIFSKVAMYMCFINEIQVKGALMNAVYRKTMRIPAHDRASAGALTNHMQVDAENMGQLMHEVVSIGVVPLQVALSLTLLYLRIGFSAIVSFVLTVIAAGIMTLLATKTLTLEQARMQETDERIRLTSEAIQSIRTLKLFGWTPLYQSRIEHIRRRELGHLRGIQTIMATQVTFAILIPTLLALVTFSLWSVVGSGARLTTQTVFSVLSILAMLGEPINSIIWGFGPIASTIAAYRRLHRFFECIEMDPTIVTVRSSSESEDVAVSIRNGYFFWAQGTRGAQSDTQNQGECDDDVDPEPSQLDLPLNLNECALKDVNLTIRKRSLTAIISTVGQGKSSLVAAMIGEIYKAQGEVIRYGRVAYVAQSPFIVNATVRDNICFGLPYDQARYARVIEACALLPDFEVLAKGDLTMIGEQGINLSGGQRARVACARAVYCDADIYIFDDPMSAVDAMIDKHMFDRILGPNSLLKDRTRVLVTHAVQHLPEMDQIVALDNGTVSQVGTYNELMARASMNNDAQPSVFSRLVTAIEARRHSGLPSRVHKQPKQAPSPTPEEIEDPTETVGHCRRESITSTGLQNVLLGDDGSSPDNSATLFARATTDDDDRDKEGMERGSISSAVYLAYIKLCGVYPMVFNLFLTSASLGVTLGVQYVLGAWASAVERDTNNSAISQHWLQVFVLMVAGTTVLTGASLYHFFVMVSISCTERISSSLLGRVLRLPMSFFDVTPSGRITNRFSKDQAAIDQDIPQQVHNLYFSTLELVAIITAIAIATPWILAILVPMGFIFYRIQHMYLCTSRELQRLQSISMSPIFQSYSELLQGVSTIRAHGQESRFFASMEDKIDTGHKPRYTLIGIFRWLDVTLQLIAAAILFAAGLLAALAPEKGPVLIGVSLTFAQQIMFTLVFIVRSFCDIETDFVAFERVREYSERIAPEAPDATNPHLNLDRNWPAHGSIEFRDYATRYRPGLDLVLRNLSLQILAGERIAIVGRTGSGKSSTLAALFRLMESAQGSIVVDGVNVAEVGLLDLRTRLTVLPQEPVIFEGTIRENLDPLGQCDDAALWAALKASHLDRVVAGMDGGLDTQVKAGQLSTGESQLLCLGRALLRKTKVLALDESSASLDHATDELVQATIRQEFKDCTVLCIAHRIASTVDFDRVLVLENGEMVEFDSPKALLANPESRYYALAKSSGLVH